MRPGGHAGVAGFPCSPAPPILRRSRPWRGRGGRARQRRAADAASPLIVWNGNNENIWGFDEGLAADHQGGRELGLGYYLDILPKLCAEIDPDRPYYPGSSLFRHDGDRAERRCAWVQAHMGCVERRGLRGLLQLYPARFCSESGWQAPPNWATLEESVYDAPLTPVVQRRLPSPEGDAGQRQAHPWADRPPARAADDERLAFRHAAEPGSRHPLCRRAHAFAPRYSQGRRCLAVQRLLAGDPPGRRWIWPDGASRCGMRCGRLSIPGF